MTKILNIGWKDLRVIFRDPAALILMLAAPFVLALGLGLVTGSLASGGDSGLGDIPVVISNLDDGQLGQALVDVLNSGELAGLVAPAEIGDPAAARRQVDDDLVAAAIIVPAGFTNSIIPTDLAGAQRLAGDGSNTPAIEVYTNPGRPVSSGVVRAIVEEFVNRVETGRIAGQVAVMRLLESDLISLGGVLRAGTEMGQRLADQPGSLELVSVRRTAVGAADDDDFNPMAILAPSMALLFLMYTVTLGGRSILAERQQGTLARLLATPTRSGQVLVGKVVGTYLLGAAQLAILLAASSLLYRLRWGDPLGVALLILAAAAGATGWGLLIAAIARTPSQVSSIGTAMMLLFGLLGGSFFGSSLPGLLEIAGKITPNAWGLDGFWILARGGGVAQLLPVLAALLVMAAALISISVLLFNRKGVLQR